MSFDYRFAVALISVVGILITDILTAIWGSSWRSAPWSSASPSPPLSRPGMEKVDPCPSAPSPRPDATALLVSDPVDLRLGSRGWRSVCPVPRCGLRKFARSCSLWLSRSWLSRPLAARSTRSWPWGSPTSLPALFRGLVVATLRQWRFGCGHGCHWRAVPVTIVSLVVYRTVTRKDVVLPIPHKRTAIERLASIRRWSG